MNADKLLKSLKGKTNQELQQLLEEAYARIEQLELQVKKQSKSLQKYKTSAAKARQQARSLEGSLKAEQAKVAALRKTLKTQKVKVKKAEKRQKAAEAEVATVKNLIKQIKPTMSREQVFELYKVSNQNRFWERMTSVHQFDPEKLAEMQQKMATWDSQKLRDIIRIAGWRSTWYDSDAEWNASELAGWDERNTYAFIMSY